jgi:hypothetical protein
MKKRDFIKTLGLGAGSLISLPALMAKGQNYYKFDQVKFSLDYKRHGVEYYDLYFSLKEKPILRVLFQQKNFSINRTYDYSNNQHLVFVKEDYIGKNGIILDYLKKEAYTVSSWGANLGKTGIGEDFGYDNCFVFY